MSDPLQNLRNAMVEDILSMSDEEIMAEATAEELAETEAMRRRVLAMLDRQGTSNDYKRAIADAIEVLKGQMGDGSAGEDMRKIYDSILSVAIHNVRRLRDNGELTGKK